MAGFLYWLWTGTDHGPLPVEQGDIGGGIVLPTYATGPVTTSWWAVVSLMLVSGTSYACLIGTYLFLWLVNGDARWTAQVPLTLPGGVALLAYLASGGAMLLASSSLQRRPVLVTALVPAALLLLLAGLAADGYALWGAGLRPAAHAHAASCYALVAWQGTHVAVATVMAPYVVARRWAGLLDGRRRVTFDVVLLFWLYTVGQGAVGLVLLHGFPRLL